jgi:methionyl-tRNA formyltransferase
MRVLLLSPYPERLRPILERCGAAVEVTDARLPPESPLAARCDFVVSYGYGHILRPAHLQGLDGRAINLHISLLPWNRGASPNFWSFFDDTPKGVSIHGLDAGIDSGDLIAQTAVAFAGKQTLASSYSALQAQIEALFGDIWPAIACGQASRRPQPPGGSYHFKRDLQPHWPHLSAGWETPVVEVAALGRRWRAENARGIGE